MANSAKTILQLYSEHKGKASDKWTSYLYEYDPLLEPFRDRPIHLLEIGVQNGGGLEIWAEYFHYAEKIIGCDIDPKCADLKYDDPRIVLVLGDANARSTQSEILSISSRLDIVFDDGSHHSGDVIKSFLNYFANVTDGGIYVIEDLHTSYWNEYEGGLFDPFSSITFFKHLVDIVNFEHWGVNRTPSGILLGFQEKYGVEIDPEIMDHIHSIKFINSLCVIQKSGTADNKLGKRFVAGSQAIVSPIIIGLDKSISEAPQQLTNPWSTRIRPPEEDILGLEQSVKALTEKVAEEERSIGYLEAQRAENVLQITSLDAQIAEKVQAIKSLQALAGAKDQQIQDLLAQISQKEQGFKAQLNGINTSSTWRLALLFRRVQHKIIPPNSIRARLFSSILAPVLYLMKVRQSKRLKKEKFLVGASNFWDGTWYLAQNRDVAQANLDPLSHYLAYGGFEGRDPSPQFSSSRYLENYPDVKEAGLNPLVHYIRYGQKEGRSVFDISGTIPPTANDRTRIDHNKSSVFNRVFESVLLGSYKLYRRLPVDGVLRQKVFRTAFKFLPLTSRYKQKINQIIIKRRSGSSFYTDRLNPGTNLVLADKDGSGLAFPSYLLGMDMSSLRSLLNTFPWQGIWEEKTTEAMLPLDQTLKVNKSAQALFSIILFVQDTPAHFLYDSINSVRKQSFENWRLNIYVKTGSLWNANILGDQLEDEDARIRVKESPPGLNSMDDFKQAVLDSDGEYVILVNPYDGLRQDAFQGVADEIMHSPFDLVYCPNENSDQLGNQSNLDQYQISDDPKSSLGFSQFIVWRKNYLLDLFPVQTGSFQRDLNYFRDNFTATNKPKTIKISHAPYYKLSPVPGRILLTISGNEANPVLTITSIPLRLLIDARLINREITGTERYILELLKALSSLRKEYNLDLKAISSIHPKEKIDGVEFITTRPIEAIRNSHVFHKTFPASDGKTLAEMAFAPSAVFSPLDLILYSHPDYFMNEQDFHNFRQVMQIAADLSDEMVSISNHGKSDIERLLHIPGKLVSPVYLGVHPERFSVDPHATPEKLKHLKVPPNYFLFIGTNYPHKNLVTLLEAFKLIQPSLPDVSLVLVGTNYYLRPQPELDKLHKDLSPHIIQLGHVPDDFLPALYNGAIALVYPSLYEGFGLPLIEAMLCGTPVIASDVASIPEVTGNAALLVNGRDANQIASAMLRVRSDQDLRDRLIQAGFRNARKFTWENTAREMIGCYQKAVSNAVRNPVREQVDRKLNILNELRTSPPTILIVTHIRFYPPAAGNELRLFKLVKYFKKLGYRIVMLVNPFIETTQLDQAARSKMYEYLDYYEEIGEVAPEDQGNTPSLSQIGNEPELDRLKNFEKSFCPDAVISRTRNLIERFSPKILLAEYIWTSSIFACAPRNILRVIDTIDMFSRKEQNVVKFGIRDDLSITPSEELAFINRSDVIIAIQNVEAQAFKDLSPSCRVITAGVDYEADSFSEGLAKDPQPLSLLIIGSGNQLNVTCVKEFLEQSWLAILTAVPACRLRIVGKVCHEIDGNYPGVELIPYCEDLDSIYQSATLVINPVYAGTGLKIKSVEALGHGKALICWPEGAMGINHAHLRPLIIIKSWKDMAETVVDMLIHSDKRSELEHSARDFASSTLSGKVIYRQVADCFDAYTKRELKVLCLFLRYGTKEYPESMDDLRNWYEKKMAWAETTTWIIDNKIEAQFDGIDLKTGFRLLSGDNSEREFSAFQKILIEHREEIASYDVVHFVTSAFNTIFTSYLDYFSGDLLELVTHRSYCLGHIDSYDEPFQIVGEISQSWIRTCFFFTSPETAYSIPGFVSFRDENQFFDGPGNFLVPGQLSENYRKFILNWLNGQKIQGVTWHPRKLDSKAFQEKTLAILNEHMLSIHMRKAGIDLLDFYWAKENIENLISSIDFKIPNPVDEVKIRQAGLFGVHSD